MFSFRIVSGCRRAGQLKLQPSGQRPSAFCVCLAAFISCNHLWQVFHFAFQMRPTCRVAVLCAFDLWSSNKAIKINLTVIKLAGLWLQINLLIYMDIYIYMYRWLMLPASSFGSSWFDLYSAVANLISCHINGIGEGKRSANGITLP